MREIVDDIWDLYDKGATIVIPTNGTVKADGRLVMGRGLAAEAKARFPGIDLRIGLVLLQTGFPGEQKIQYLEDHRLLTFPVKHNYWEKASLALVERSADALQRLRRLPLEVFLPRVGCGNGHRKWEDVRPILEVALDDRFVVVERRWP